MPLKEINCEKTHFYKIVCKDTSIKDCYVDLPTSHQENTTTKQNVIIVILNNAQCQSINL